MKTSSHSSLLRASLLRASLLRASLLRARGTLFALATAAFMPGCIHHDNDAQQDVDREADCCDSSLTCGTYVDLGDFITSDADIERWSEIRRGLDARFDEVCGDTFCEGDYSNIESLGFTCSVSSNQGRIRECVWMFAASAESVDGASGSIAASVPFYECRVRPTGAVRELLEAFGDDPLNSELPGLSGSLYDALGGCFDNPLGATVLPAPSEGPYRDVAAGLEDGEIDAWYAMTAALRADFDAICGDSFCEGDYANLQSLRLRCSESTETGKLGTCAWIFAGSATSRDASGFIQVSKQDFTCSFPVDATHGELAAALAPGASETNVLFRPLPNTTTSLNDAILGCF
jgi:hypothetical protein